MDTLNNHDVTPLVFLNHLFMFRNISSSLHIVNEPEHKKNSSCLTSLYLAEMGF